MIFCDSIFLGDNLVNPAYMTNMAILTVVKLLMVAIFNLKDF